MQVSGPQGRDGGMGRADSADGVVEGVRSAAGVEGLMAGEQVSVEGGGDGENRSGDEDASEHVRRVGLLDARAVRNL